jgi:hypothetical protein
VWTRVANVDADAGAESVHAPETVAFDKTSDGEINSAKADSIDTDDQIGDAAGCGTPAIMGATVVAGSAAVLLANTLKESNDDPGEAVSTISDDWAVAVGNSGPPVAMDIIELTLLATVAVAVASPLPQDAAITVTTPSLPVKMSLGGGCC